MLKTVKYLLGGFCLCFSVLAVAESEDIMVLPLEKGIDGLFRLKVEPTHITQREGYDNQPKFDLKGNAIYFTRMLDKNEGEGQQTDIFRYDIESGKSVNVTQTEDSSEYSPTPYNADFLSIVGVNTAGEQHLRLLNLETKEHKVLRGDIEPVGYFAWLQPSKAGTFVLGDVMTLQILDTESDKKPLVLAENIGRCMEAVADNVITFTQEQDDVHEMYSLASDGTVKSLEISLPKGVQDYVWLSDEQVIVGKGAKLFLVSSESTTELGDLSSLEVGGITRLALSPDKSKLAIVYRRP